MGHDPCDGQVPRQRPASKCFRFLPAQLRVPKRSVARRAKYSSPCPGKLKDEPKAEQQVGAVILLAIVGRKWPSASLCRGATS